MTVIARPAADGCGQYLLATRIADVPTATCQLLELRFQFQLGLAVETQLGLAPSCVKGVAKELLAFE